MNFADNIIKEYLKNVYFITGNPCGGKTTTSRALSKKYNVPVYDIDEIFEKHQAIADPVNQPNMCRQFKDADEFFGRSVEEYREWLLGNTREQLDFVLLDLMRLSANGKIICDCHLTLEQAESLSDPSRVAFLIREPKNIVESYCNRPDHQGFSDFIHSATDYEKAAKRCEDTLVSLNAENYRKIKEGSWFYIEREANLSLDKVVERVANHFGWDMESTEE